MVAGFRPVSSDDKGLAAELSDNLGLEGDAESYVVCSKVLNGVLVVNRERGHAIYKTPVDWVNDDCSLAE